jgi:hypothetical protein
MMMSDSKESDDSNEDEDNTVCPLFMEGLPTDFSTNPQLAALASLLGDDEEDGDKEESKHAVKSVKQVAQPKSGGGKCRPVKSRKGRTGAPYNPPEKKESKASASVGEANLFMKMWKL